MVKKAEKYKNIKTNKEVIVQSVRDGWVQYRFIISNQLAARPTSEFSKKYTKVE